jgi:murein DD-endopeptidase MepM/ murein hydrolase activator NlpD
MTKLKSLLLAVALLPGPAMACGIPSIAAGADPAFVWPLYGKYLGGYGMRIHPVLNFMRMHDGVDIGAEIGTPIRAPQQGRVVEKKYKGDNGNFLAVDHGGGWETSYAHFRSYADGVNAGDCVNDGQTIGFVGMTGLTGSPHLHFEVQHHGATIDPLTVLPKQ